MTNYNYYYHNYYYLIIVPTFQNIPLCSIQPSYPKINLKYLLIANNSRLYECNNNNYNNNISNSYFFPLKSSLKCPLPLIFFFSHQKIYLFPISLEKKLQLYVFSSIFCEFLKFWKYAPLWFTAEFEGEWVEFGLWRQRGNWSAWLCTETSKKVVQNMPDRCVAASCSNVADPSKGIFVQTIPFFGDSWPEAIKRPKKWVDFVKAKRAKWEPMNPRVIQITIFKCNVVLRDITAIRVLVLEWIFWICIAWRHFVVILKDFYAWR